MEYRRSQKNQIPSDTDFDIDDIANETVEVNKAQKKIDKIAKKKEHYVDSVVFLNQIRDYYNTDILIDELSISLYKIAVGLSFASNFINYTYKDEMIGDAVYKMFVALKNKKFDVTTRNNPFSYFTTIAFHAFINRIKKEKRYRDTLTRYQENIFTEKLLQDPSVNIYIPDLSPDDAPLDIYE